MTKTLLLISGASFVLCLVCFSIGVAIGGADLWRHGWPLDGAHFNIDDGGVNITSADDSPVVTRQMVWNGSDTLDLGAPGTVHFTQAPGPGKLVVTGPKSAVDHLTLSGARLDYDDERMLDDGRIDVTMTAPNVRRFIISGDDTLSIAGYDQDDLTVNVSGDGQVTAKGKAHDARLDISGDGDVDLSGLSTASADADISGSGHASLAPTDAADLRISGSGEIDLLTHPASLNTDVTGSGRINEGAAAASAAAAAKPS